MDNHALQVLLGGNAIELSFVRRHEKLGWSNIRSLLGTTNYKFLNGPFGKQVINFVPPKGIGMGYDYKSKGLCVVYDMLRQDYRVFGSEQVSIRQQWPLTTDEEIAAFEQYFMDKIMKMSDQEKLDFMGYTGNTTSLGYVPNKPNTVPQEVPKQQKVSLSQNLKNRFTGFFNRVKKWFAKH